MSKVKNKKEEFWQIHLGNLEETNWGALKISVRWSIRCFKSIWQYFISFLLKKLFSFWYRDTFIDMFALTISEALIFWAKKMPSFYPKNFRFFFRKYYSSHSTHLKLVIELLKFKFAFLSRKKLKNFHIFSSKSKKKQINNCKTSFLKLVFPKNKKQLEKILHKFHREKSNNKKIHGCEIYFFKLNFNHISVVKKTMNIFSDSI